MQMATIVLWPVWVVSVTVLPLTECYAMIAKMINIPSDFNKSIFWMIIQFLIIIHSYHQDYVDGEDDADRMGHLLKNVIWEKVNKVLKETFHIHVECFALTHNGPMGEIMS